MKKRRGTKARVSTPVFTIIFLVCLLLAGCGAKTAQPSSASHSPEPTLLATPALSPTPTATPVPTPTSTPTPLPTPLPKELYPTEEQLLVGVAQADLFGFLPDDYEDVYNQYYPNGTAAYNDEFLRWYADKLKEDRKAYIEFWPHLTFEPFFITVPLDLNNDGYDDYLTLWENAVLYSTRYTTTVTLLLSDSNGSYSEGMNLARVMLPNRNWSACNGGRSSTRIDVLEEVINGVRVLRLTDEVWHEEFYGEAYTGIPNYLYGFRYTYFYYDPIQKTFNGCTPVGSDLLAAQELALSVIR